LSKNPLSAAATFWFYALAFSYFAGQRVALTNPEVISVLARIRIHVVFRNAVSRQQFPQTQCRVFRIRGLHYDIQSDPAARGYLPGLRLIPIMLVHCCLTYSPMISFILVFGFLVKLSSVSRASARESPSQFFAQFSAPSGHLRLSATRP
jgi:hypothetical protein